MTYNTGNNIGKEMIPRSVIERYPRYYRKIRELLGSDILRISSGDISKLMGLTPSQVRKDFSYLGGIGQQGYGYNVKDLYRALGNAIGIFENYTAVIIGGDRESALLFASLPFFTSRGVTLKRIFTDEGIDFDFPIQFSEGSLTSETIPEHSKAAYRAANYIRKEKISIAVLICDKSEAQQSAQTMSDAGILGIWNLTGADILIPSDISIESFNPTDSLLTLCCAILQNKNKKDGI